MQDPGQPPRYSSHYVRNAQRALEPLKPSATWPSCWQMKAWIRVFLIVGIVAFAEDFISWVKADFVKDRLNFVLFFGDK